MFRPLKITLLLFTILLGLSGCKNVADYSNACKLIDCELAGFKTTSTVPTDIASYPMMTVETKANTYIESSYRQSSPLHDSYGFLLPYDLNVANAGEPETHGQQADAAMWNSVALANMCMLQAAGNTTLDTEISTLWANIRDQLLTSDGRPIRHPQSPDELTISRDIMGAFQYLGAIAFHFNCVPVKSEFGEWIARMTDYGRNHNWEMGIGLTNPTVTTLTNRRQLSVVLELYGKSTENLDIASSTENLSQQSFLADYIFENTHYCRRGFAGACIRTANFGSFANNLTYQSAVTMTIGRRHGVSQSYTENELKAIWLNIAKVGDSVGKNNWLFVAGYRYWNQSTPTFNDIKQFLAESFPTTLPGSANAIEGWGCSDFIWQRVPYQICKTGVASTWGYTYIGNDYLSLYAYIKLAGS